MKICLKELEHVRISHDNPECGFHAYIEQGFLHIRAKSPDEPQGDRTTLVIESRVELSK